MDRSAYEKHYELDQEHFWRIAKRQLVLEWIGRYSHPQRGQRRRLLDIGGACSVISRQLNHFGQVTVVEPDEESVVHARTELGLSVVVGALPHDLPVTGRFDVITVLDVLEHVDDDRESLLAINALLQEEGIVVLTVPAYQWLWSEHDLALHHRRRYSRRRLCRLLWETGFDTVRISYYTTLLFPALVAQRLVNRRGRAVAKPRYRVRTPPRFVNVACGAVMSLERCLLRYTNLPLGSSLIAVAKRAAKPRRVECPLIMQLEQCTSSQS